jgi:penicillin-binding protein 1A
VERSNGSGDGRQLTATDLARELGVPASTLRSWLRRTYGRPGGEAGEPWQLTEEQVAAARRRYADGDGPVERAAMRIPRRSGPRRPHSRDHRLDDELRVLFLRQRRRGRRRRAFRRRWLTVVLVLLVAPFAILVGAVAATALEGPRVLRSTCSLDSLRPLRIGQNSFIFAKDGSLLGSIPSEKNRQPLTIKQMSPWLPKATVAIEDRRFYEHGGLDYRGILRAAVTNAERGRIVQGGSTITQQLVRNLYIGDERRTLRRKLKEACLALRLSSAWSRDRILITYLNQVYYGNHAFGAEAAAQTYFSKRARDLTLPQAALIAGLPQAPSVYDPFRRPDAALERRNDVLRALGAAGYISPGLAARLTSVPLRLHPGGLYTRIRQPYFFSYVEQQLIDQYGPERVETGGLRVRTTIDPKLQSAARLAMKSVLKEKTDPSAALVAIDPRSGAIKAMEVDVPSGEHLQFNLAAQGHRQAGSAFKPFVLATAVKQGISLSSTFSGPPELTIPDERCYTGYEPWDVHNFADESAGTMDLRNAIAHSVNTIFAQLVLEVGPENVVQTAHAMGIVSPLQAVCSITLGTQPVSPLEMTSGYATLAAHGVHRTPQSLRWVRSPRGKVLPRDVARPVQALTENEADLVTSALQGVVQFGTGTAAGLYDRPAAGKTGTAEDFQDAWFCGYVPQLVTCVWLGYPHRELPMYNVEGFAQVFGGSIPAAIWHDFMSVALENVPVEYFNSAYDSGHTVGPPVQVYTPTPAAPESSTTSSSTEASPPPAPPVETTTIAPTTTEPVPPPPTTTTPEPPPTTTTVVP